MPWAGPWEGFDDMRSLNLGELLRPFIEAHPWLAPLFAGGTVIGYAIRILLAVWKGVQKDRQLDHAQSADFLAICKDQRDVALRDAENWRKRAERAEAELEEMRKNSDE